MKGVRQISITGCCLLLLAAVGSVGAQGWKRALPHLLYPVSVRQTADGGAYMLANYRTPATGQWDIALLKIGPDGRTQWQRTLGGPADDLAQQLLPLPDGGAAVTGFYGYDANSSDAVLAAYGPDGAERWQRLYDFAPLDGARAVCRLPNGGFLLALEAQQRLRLLRTDASGNLQWTQDYPQTAGLLPRYLEQTPDGHFLATLVTQPFQLIPPTAHLLKIDPDGAILFSRSFPYTAVNPAATYSTPRARPLDDTTYQLVFRDSVYRLDTAGARRAAFRIGPPDGELILTDFAGAPDGGFWALGTHNVINPGLSSQIFYGRFSASGVPQWLRYDQAPADFHQTQSLERLADGGFMLGGSYSLNNVYYTYLLRTDSLGRVFTNRVEGRVGWDQNQNCLIDTGESLPAGWLLRIDHPNGERHYAATDSLGRFGADVGVGTYTVRVLPPNELWHSPCAQDVPLTFDTTFQTLTVDFPVQAVLECPRPWIDLAGPDWRPCVASTLTLRYGNQGTGLLPAAAAELRLDSLLELVSATRPYVQIAPRTFRFDLGALPPLSGGDFQVQVRPDCGLEALGQALCVRVNIRPDTVCPLSALVPFITVRGGCDGDSVRFFLKNIGAGMTAPLEFIVIEDNIMLQQGVFQLGAGAEQGYSFPANGATWRFQARQAPGLPDWQSDVAVAAAVEGCTASGAFSTGLVNQYHLYDGATAWESECRTVVDTAFGTAKHAFPTGFGPDHAVEPNTGLEYVLHFRNPGPDTAVSVVLRDTLDAAVFDPASVQPGASSHPYTYNMQGTGVLEFFFDSLFLPPAEGAGWVKFRVQQQPDLAPGTLLLNRAWAYFDYAAPVSTNETWHTVTGELLGPPAPPPAPQAPAVWAYPLPSAGAVTLETARAGSYRVLVHDAAGRLVLEQAFLGNRSELPAEHWPAGVYLAALRDERGHVYSIKIIKI